MKYYYCSVIHYSTEQNSTVQKKYYIEMLCRNLYLIVQNYHFFLLYRSDPLEFPTKLIIGAMRLYLFSYNYFLLLCSSPITLRPLAIALGPWPLAP